MDFTEIIKQKRKMIEKKRGYAYKNTYMSAANSPGLFNSVPNKVKT